jgi:hypothetical protein
VRNGGQRNIRFSRDIFHFSQVSRLPRHYALNTCEVVDGMIQKCQTALLQSFQTLRLRDALST